MMSRCWLLAAPRLTIEPSSTSVRGSVSISAYRLLPTARARSFDACGKAGSLYWASVTSPGSIEIFYQFVLRGGYNFTLVWLNSAGPAKEGIGADPGLVTLAQYNDPAFPQASKDLARAIGNSLYAVMDTLPRADVLL